MFNFARKRINRFISEIRELTGQQSRLNAELSAIREALARLTPGNPTIHGYKIYSQCDEDGIIDHIFGVLGHGERTFVEIGCSDGLENNTHALILKGWRGAWFDADTRKIAKVRKRLPVSDRLQIHCNYVTRENAYALLREATARLNAPELDFLSIDIDGDDLGVVSHLLSGGIRPRVMCVEYNAKFPPPIMVAVDPQRITQWLGDDYQGASLSSMCDEFATYGYRLVACNASGANAFFVRTPADELFPEHPVELLYQPARYHLRRLSSGHPASLAFVEDVLTGC